MKKLDNLDIKIKESIEINNKNKNLRKKDYMKNEKSYLKKGRIVPIYLNWKTQDDLMGYAKLNFKIPGDELSYERDSVGENKANEGDLVIYKYQRWNITFVDPFDFDPKMDPNERWKYLSQKNFTTNRNIAYFEAVDSNYIS